jgi:hypothetical protein
VKETVKILYLEIVIYRIDVTSKTLENKVASVISASFFIFCIKDFLTYLGKN